MMGDAGVQSRVIVGFEIHVQLATRTKLFCSCAVGFGEPPNSRICPVCMGAPGALPVMNRTAFDYAVRAGLALNCTIAQRTKWDRKSYYYPDLPKNYQISQYDMPLASDGYFEFDVDGQSTRVRIIRAHLEEDAGKNLHDVPGCTLVDLNRTGTPLLEIVTHPEITSADQAYVFCTELQKLVRYVGISDGDMQKGQLRFEPNINVAVFTDGGEVRTPISEVKNLNSFKAVRAAVEYEHRRQLEEWTRDPDYVFGRRPNENRGWDDAGGATVFQRGKESAHEYRYFPDPDLMPVESDQAEIRRVAKSLPELPVARRRRLVANHGLTLDDAEVILADRATADLYEQAVAVSDVPRTVAKQFVNVWSRLANERGVPVAALSIDGERTGGLAKMVDAGLVSASAAKRIAEQMLDSPDPPSALAASMGLLAERDTDKTAEWVAAALAANPQALADARSNPKKAKAAAGFLRGQVMKLSSGKADPKLVGELITRELDAAGGGES